MKKAEIMNKVSGTVGKIGFQLKKHSPEILIVAGVIGTVASTVMACKATTKVTDILERTKREVDVIKDLAANEGEEEYTPEDCKKAIAVTYIQTGAKIAKLYAPAVALGALSITAIVSSNNILRKRNVALAAAYATVDKGFKEYRGRVVERFGEEVDNQLRHNIRKENITAVTVDENGEEKTVTKSVNVVDGNVPTSDYAKFFDASSREWEENPEYNLMFLKAQEKYANDKLKATGYLFLNEVYDMLDIPKTQAGQVIGWIYDKENPVGDNYVDFGIYELHKSANRDFVNGLEPVILLDFNVDGYILNKI